jgi:hypothetical protein
MSVSPFWWPFARQYRWQTTGLHRVYTPLLAGLGAAERITRMRRTEGERQALCEGLNAVVGARAVISAHIKRILQGCVRAMPLPKSSEMPFREGAAGAGLQVFFECGGLCFVAEGNVGPYPPRPIFRSMRHLPGIMLGQSGSKILSYSDVKML